MTWYVNIFSKAELPMQKRVDLVTELEPLAAGLSEALELINFTAFRDAGSQW